MIRAVTVLMFLLGAWAWADVAAAAKGGCVEPRPPTVKVPPIRKPAPPEPRYLPPVHRAEGLRTAGSGTGRLRTFRLRATGYLSLAKHEGITAASRHSRAHVSFSLGIADWGKQIRLVVDMTTDFTIILRSDNPESFDSFEFIEVEPGTYVFTLDSLGPRREPVDVDLQHGNRIIAKRTVRPEAMEHPAPALSNEQNDGGRGRPIRVQAAPIPDPDGPQADILHMPGGTLIEVTFSNGEKTRGCFLNCDGWTFKLMKEGGHPLRETEYFLSGVEEVRVIRKHVKRT
jgi:hypothetical protein